MTRSATELIHRFAVSERGELLITLSHQDETSWVELQLVNREASPEAATPTVRVPLAQLPELKRALSRIETKLSAAGLLEDYEGQEDYQLAQAPRFANDSEVEFARLLNFYRIKWLYEPHTFPIVWDAEGNVVESFTPDFYLEDYHLYIELTTMKQSLVTKKNRKVRLFRELYPQQPIRLFYGKDYQHLLQKYGLTPATRT
ncbi:MAG: hypothetical protein BZ151_04810 [Desulfobacca sp. 4484_104]|nr:MAG: hypothetical protein BZ151_04810 [Desulfobacca sp. 4484_104]RLA86726.1 MAG: hypothetical protein DRG58_11715 [Deltaproteobacteria bacterium]